MGKDFLIALGEILTQEQILTEEMMGRHTTFRVGGPAQYYLKPKADQVAGILSVCRDFGVPYMIIGNGSNLLVSDKGIRGAVIEIGRQMEEISVEGNTLTVSAGTLLVKAAKAAEAAGLAGMEFAAGIPGCVGGAVVMNAGAYGGEIKDILKTATVLTKDGQVLELTPEQLDLSYRHSNIADKEYIVLQAEFVLEQGDKAEISAKMRELNQQRQEKQPLEYPSAGSTFKRPEGYFAGKLIQDAGLKGYRVGGAMVSDKHSGFVVNVDNATATDIRQLMKDVAEKVKEQFLVELEPEVRIIGEWE